MKIDLNLKINEKYDEYPEDTDMIIRACKRFGLELSRSEAIYFWECYSDSLAAGWMILPDSELDLYDRIKNFIMDEIDKTLHTLN